MAHLPGRKLRHDEILPFLGEIGKELERLGLTADIYVGGGAAMAVRHGASARELTDDIDGAFRKNQTILDLAAQITAREGLQADWINDSFTGFLPGARSDTEAMEVQLGGLTARFASDRFLLAMKMQAARAKDVADTRMLIRALRLHRAADIANLTVELYGDASVPRVDYEDLRLHAQQMLRVVGREDPSWPSDPDDTPKEIAPQRATEAPQQAKSRGKSSPASTPGSFQRRVNSPPDTTLTK